MRRRELLGLCGTALAATAGCLSTDPGSDATTDGTPTDDGNGDGSTPTGTPGSTPTADPTPTPSPTPSGVALSVSVEALRPAVRQLYTDAIGVSSEPNTQYLFLELSTSAGRPPERSDLAFRFDGEGHPPSEAQRADDLYRLYNESESRYDADGGEGWILFPLPDGGDAGDAALVWPGGEWRPDEQLRSRLATPSPPLSLEWSVPDPVTLGSNPDVELTVTNEGDVAGHFVGAINRRGWKYAYYPLTTVDRTIPAGETETWTVTDDMGIDRDGNGTTGDGDPDVTYLLRWPGERRRASVRVVEG